MSKNHQKKSKTSGFLNKLLQILQDSNSKKGIQWIQKGDMFLITNTIEFIENMLPKYFKHQNFSSFIRQLNMYGFKKEKREKDENVWSHPYFKQGNKIELKKIRRKVVKNQVKDVQSIDNSSPVVPKNDFEIEQMKVIQKDLEEKCQQLILENQKLIRENAQMARKVQSIQKKKQQLFAQLSQANHLSTFHNSTQEMMQQRLIDSYLFESKRERSISTYFGGQNFPPNDDQAISQLFSNLNEKLFSEGDGEQQN